MEFVDDSFSQRVQAFEYSALLGPLSTKTANEKWRSRDASGTIMCQLSEKTRTISGRYSATYLYLPVELDLDGRYGDSEVFFQFGC